jgi:hypothetical protein
MVDGIQLLLDQYSKWLKDRTHLRQVDDWVGITTPFLDRHNDYMQIYVRRDNGAWVLTDGGHTVRDLESSGCGLSTPKRQELLRTTLNGFGVRMDEDALSVSASKEDFPPTKKQNLNPVQNHRVAEAVRLHSAVVSAPISQRACTQFVVNHHQQPALQLRHTDRWPPS